LISDLRISAAAASVYRFICGPAVEKTWRDGPIQPDVTARAVDDREK